jgi:hypothetical protein
VEHADQHRLVETADKIQILRPDGSRLFTLSPHQRPLAEQILVNLEQATRRQQAAHAPTLPRASGMTNRR